MGKRLALFGSGRGSNGEAIYKAIEAGYIEGEIVLIISDRPNVGIVEKGRAWYIPVHIVEPANYGTEAAWTQAMLDLLQEYEVEGILLAGYMRILPPTFVQAYRGNILNIHPSLLPAFTGLQAQKQALLKVPFILWMKAWIRVLSLRRRWYLSMKMTRWILYQHESCMKSIASTQRRCDYFARMP